MLIKRPKNRFTNSSSNTPQSKHNNIANTKIQANHKHQHISSLITIINITANSLAVNLVPNVHQLESNDTESQALAGNSNI